MVDKHTGACFCGAVRIEVSGSPEAMGYCHCASCRSWSAGDEFLGHFMKTPTSDRKFCTRCGGHVMTEHPTFGLIDVYAATIPDVAFKPGVHVNYAESVLPMKDGLPKLRDFPAELGGSGVAIGE